MKFLRVLVVIVSITGSACPPAAANTINFGTLSGNLGNGHSYTAGGLTVLGSAVNASTGATTFIGKNAGQKALQATFRLSGEHSFANGDDR